MQSYYCIRDESSWCHPVSCILASLFYSLINQKACNYPLIFSDSLHLYKKSRYFRIGNICHQLRNLYDTEAWLLRYPHSCNVEKRLCYSRNSYFLIHFASNESIPRQTILSVSTNHWLSVKNHLLYLLSLNDFHFLLTWYQFKPLKRPCQPLNFFFCWCPAIFI